MWAMRPLEHGTGNSLQSLSWSRNYLPFMDSKVHSILSVYHHLHTVSWLAYSSTLKNGNIFVRNVGWRTIRPFIALFTLEPFKSMFPCNVFKVNLSPRHEGVWVFKVRLNSTLNFGHRPGSQGSTPGGDRDLPLLHKILTDSQTHPLSYPVGSGGGPYPGGGGAAEAWNWSLTST
jgi:hypothetical protein